MMANGNALPALTEAPDPNRAIPGDKFDEYRVCLDHLSFGVNSMSELEATAQIFDQDGIPHGEIKDLGADLTIYLLSFHDPDDIQLELSAPYS
jgi:glyoxylase I family protein